MRLRTSTALAPGRRAFLIGGAAAFTASSVVGRASSAQGAGPRRIDVHNHLIPPAYLKYNRAEIVSGADTDPTPVLQWSPARMIEDMDRHGIAVAMLSMSSPGVSMLGGTRDQIRALARSCNEYAASLRGEYPHRLGSFAAMPLPDVEGALAEAAYALDVLHADGIGLYTSYAGRYLGDPAFKPFFAELDRRNAVVFVHPTTPHCCLEVLPGIEPSLLDYLFDVTRSITSLLFAGTFATFPSIRFIFSQGGGATSTLAARINAWGARHHRFADAIPNGVNYELRRLYFDIANSTSPLTLTALRTLAPGSQLLFGSDTPYVPMDTATGEFDRTPLAASVRAAINRGNALRLFPRLDVDRPPTVTQKVL